MSCTTLSQKCTERESCIISPLAAFIDRKIGFLTVNYIVEKSWKISKRKKIHLNFEKKNCLRKKKSILGFRLENTDYWLKYIKCKPVDY